VINACDQKMREVARSRAAQTEATVAYGRDPSRVLDTRYARTTVRAAQNVDSRFIR